MHTYERVRSSWCMLIVLALVFAVSISMDETRAESATDGGGGLPPSGTPEDTVHHVLPENGHTPFLYDVQFSLEVEGQITLSSPTRYYRFDTLRLRARSRIEKGQYRYEVLGLVTEHDALNFGVGEGPRRHQRYVLVDKIPSKEQMARINAHILEWEKSVGSAGALLETDGRAEDELEGRQDAQAKKAFFNYFLWKNPSEGFSFTQAYYGAINEVDNRTKLEEIIKQGGIWAKPRFFETLEYVLRAIPPFVDRVYDGRDFMDAAWEVPCRPIMEGLVTLCREVYGRKMTLLEPRTSETESIRYGSYRVPGTTVVKIHGALRKGTASSIRISGLKGVISVEFFDRKVLFDAATGRILRDDLTMEFGVERDARFIAVKGKKNRVQIELADSCIKRYPDSDSGIALAVRECAAGGH